MTESNECTHRWKTDDVAWDYREEPAQSPECNVSAHCEMCGLETVFNFEKVDAQDPATGTSMEVSLL